MKNFYSSLCAIIALALICPELSAKEYNIGAKTGMNISTTSNYGNHYQAIIGATAGVVGEYISDSFWGLTIEALYSEHGNIYNNKSLDFKVTNKDLYLDIPILFNYHVAKGFSINAGVQPSIFLKRVRSVEIQGEDGGTTRMSASDANLKKIDIAVPIGVSYRLECGVIFDARYSFGTTDCWKANITENKYRNNTFSISAGYLF